ncbi:MAG: hypothetical protein LWX56_13410 [Ignavibacteria bacterium]|nr:hypothetical protein [Ignavibacteria bacterium]
MNIVLPHNVFTSLFLQAAPEHLKKLITFKPSSMLGTLLQENKADIVLLPSTDLIKHTDFFVSSRRGISFDGPLSNSYLYFQPNQLELTDFALAGDISGTDVICLKILMQELYDRAISIKLLSSLPHKLEGNTLIAGDHNYTSGLFAQGMNLTEEMVELLDLPFVNYVFCANSQEKLEWLHTETAGIEQQIYAEVENPEWDYRLTPEAKTLFSDEIAHVLYEFEDQDKEALIQVLRLPYFHGMIDDIFNIHFV